MSDESGKSPGWDIRKYRIKQIGELVGKTEHYLDKTYREKSLEEAESWFAAVRTLWSSIKHYVDDEEEIEEIESMIDAFHDKVNSENAMDQLRRKDFKKLHEQLHRVRIEKAGMDLPMEAESEEDVEDFYI